VSTVRINISNLQVGVHERALEANPEEIGLDDRFSRTIQLNASLEKTSRQLFLRVAFSTVGRFTCDRCLDEYHSGVAGSYQLVYVTDERASAGLEHDEIHLISPEANYIDLAEDVRQFVLLALPQKLLCREECAGLCPVCGVNHNHAGCSCTVEEIDPRWEALRKFQAN
jgi:uncharacterized protein